MSVGTVGCSTSTIVEDTNCFGRTRVPINPTPPNRTVVSNGIHQCRRSIRFTSADVISPFRTIFFRLQIIPLPVSLAWQPQDRRALDANPPELRMQGRYHETSARFSLARK